MRRCLGCQVLRLSQTLLRVMLCLTANAQVLVLDATADSTVTSGAATYVYRHSDTSWHKVSEAKVWMWSDLECHPGAPSSTPAQIDAAVTNSHAHSNKTQLDNIGQDSDGNLTYGGNLPKIGWDTKAW